MRKTLILLLATGLLLAGYFFLPQFLGEILKNIFREGTGCAVKLTHPQINYFSLSASIEDVSIICPEEIKEEGFFADKVFIQIDSQSLWNKTVKVSDLKVEGTSTRSLIAESAFIRTLKFILQKPPKPKISTSERGWHVWVPRVEVIGKKSTPSIFFGTRGFYVAGEAVEFIAEDPVDSPLTPVVLKANSRESHLSIDDIKLTLGNAQYVAEAGGGVVDFKQAIFREGEQVIEITGDIDIKKDIFNLGFLGGIKLGQFGEWVGSKSKGVVKFQGQISEDIYNPVVVSNFDFAVQDEYNEECKINGGLAKLRYQDFILSLDNLEVQNIAKSDKLILGFKNGFTARSEVPIDLNLDSKVLQACIPSSASSLIRILGRGEHKLNFSTEKGDNKANLDLALSSNDYESVRVLVEKEASRLKVVSKFSLLGMDNNLSKLDFEFENGIADFKHLEISTLPLHVLVDLVSILNTQSTTISEVINRKGFLQSNLSFGGEGLINFNEINQSSFNGKGEIKNLAVPLASISLTVEKDVAELLVLNQQSKKTILSLNANNSKLSGNVSLHEVRVSDLLFIPSSLNESISTFGLEGSFSGSVDSPHLKALTGIDTSKKEGILNAELEMDKKGIQAKFVAASDFIKGIFSSDFESGVSEVNLDIGKLNLKSISFLEQLIENDIFVEGKLTFKGSMVNPFDSNGDILLKLEMPEHLLMFQPTGPIHLSLKNGTIKVDDLQINLPLSLSGYISKSDGWNLEINGEVPLSSIAKNFEAMESIQGLVSLSGKVRGDLFAPQIFGQASINESSFNLILGDTILGAEGVKGAVNFSGDKIAIDKITGELADGQFVLRGQAENIFSNEERSVSLICEAKSMKIEPVDGLFIDLDANLNFGIEKHVPAVLRGKVEVEEAVYENSVNLDTLIRAVTDFISNGMWSQKRIATGNKSSGVLTDLQITSKGGMVLDTNVVQAEFLGDLHLSADIANPHIEGKVSVLDGSFKVNQTDFQILSGELLFDNYASALNPQVTLTSEGSLRNRSGDDTKVFMSLGGTLKNTKLSLTSEGEASSKDLAKQLGVGAGGNQLKLVDEKVSNIGFRELLSPSSDLTILERVSGLTGFDDVRVETGVSVRTGEFVPQVFASRPLPGDFRGTLSSELAGDKASGAKLTYRLDDSFSFLTSWRSQAVTSASQTGGGNIGVGFQYRRTFKGLGSVPDPVKTSKEGDEDDEENE